MRLEQGGAAVTGTHAAIDAGLDLALAGAGRPNTRGRAWQDRWNLGRNSRGGWLVLADGISGGEYGERAAAATVDVASGYLLTSELDEVAVMTAIGLARAAVTPWYQRTSGGSTVSIVTITPARLVCASLGDSPVLVERDGRWRQVSPRLSGPLRAWVGSSDAAPPWLDSWPAEAGQGVIVCSDGVAARDVPVVPASDPHAWVAGLLDSHRTANGDDATVLAAVVRGQR